MAGRPRSLVPLSLFLTVMLVARQTLPVPTQTTPSPTLYGIQGFGPAGGTTVALSSTNGAVAVPAVTTISIPAGATAGSFTVRTSAVSASTNVTIYATAYGLRKGASLTVQP